MHQENILSSWLREDVDGDTVKMEKWIKEAKEEESKSGEKGGGGRGGRMGEG